MTASRFLLCWVRGVKEQAGWVFGRFVVPRHSRLQYLLISGASARDVSRYHAE